MKEIQSNVQTGIECEQEPNLATTQHGQSGIDLVTSSLRGKHATDRANWPSKYKYITNTISNFLQGTIIHNT